MKSSSIDQLTAGSQAPVMAPASRSHQLRHGSSLVRWLLPLAVLLGVLCIWQAAVEIFGLKPYFIPSPTLIARTSWDNARTIGDNAVPTIAQAVTGFAIGNTLAVILSIGAGRSRAPSPGLRAGSGCRRTG